MTGRQWRECLLLVFPAVAVWLAVIEAGDVPPRERALVWGWFLAGMAAGAAGGVLYGARSSIAPPTEAQRGCATAVATMAAIVTLIAAQWLSSLPTLVILAVVGGFMLTAVPVRALRALRHRWARDR